MKTIDIKSLLIGTLLTATIFLGIAATGVNDKWDANQQWEVRTMTHLDTNGDLERVKDKNGYWSQRVVKGGWEPFSYDGRYTLYRRRIK